MAMQDNIDSDEGNPLLGVFLLSSGLLIFSIQDVIIRLLSGGYPVHQLVFIRGVMAIWMIGAYVFWRYRWAGFRIVRPWIVLLRGALGISCFTFYYLALASLTMADTVTVNYASPIVISLLTVLIFRETLGWRRWLAILVGFSGVVIVVGPSGNLLNPAALFAVASALTYAFFSIMVRFLKHGMAGSGMAFYQMLLFVLFSGLSGLILGDGSLDGPDVPASLTFLTRPWVAMSWHDLGLIGITAIIAAFGFVMLTSAYATANPTVVAPFEYTGVLWGVGAGWIAFGEVPGHWTLLGGVMIVGSGLFILYREQVRRHRLRPRPVREPAAPIPDPPNIDAVEGPMPGLTCAPDPGVPPKSP